MSVNFNDEGTLVRALMLTEFGRLDVTTLPDPEPGPDEVVLGILATGICGSDIHGYTGENGRRQLGQVMGHESVGRVLQLGRDVTGFEFGELATFNPVIVPAHLVDEYRGREQHCPEKTVVGVAADFVSSFAERIVVPARNVVTLPSDLPVEHGALIEPIAVALHAVRRVGVQAGQSALVIGGGPIGQSVCLALRMSGVDDIVASELSPKRRALLEQLGVRTCDPADGRVPDAVLECLGAPADVAIDAVGTSRTVTDAIESTVPGARICLVGMGALELVLPAFSITTAERSLIGSFTYSSVDFRDAATWVATHPDGLDALISDRVSMSQADAAFTELASGTDTPGKVLVRMDR